MFNSISRLRRPAATSVTGAVQLLMASSLSFALLGCGGGSGDNASSSASVSTSDLVASPLASATTTLTLENAELPVEVAAQTAQPSFHLAPVQLDAPADVDAVDNSASARMAPRMQAVPAQFANLSTERLTLQSLRSADRMRAMEAPAATGANVVAPMAATSAVTTYTPAQIRAAYGFPALPAATSTLTAAQAAQLGAGQTIYIDLACLLAPPRPLQRPRPYL